MAYPDLPDYEATPTDGEIKMLLDHGWEISEDQREARLYSEEWSNINAAIYSTLGFMADHR